MEESERVGLAVLFIEGTERNGYFQTILIYVTGRAWPSISRALWLPRRRRVFMWIKTKYGYAKEQFIASMWYRDADKKWVITENSGEGACSSEIDNDTAKRYIALIESDLL